MQKILSIFKSLTSSQGSTNPLDTLPDFENFTYQIVVEPHQSRVSAWNKMRKCERRLAMYKWVEHLNDPAKAQHRVLLDDAISAFLLTFEATLQFLNDQIFGDSRQFGNWLAQQPQYDVSLRGLRTLRHFEAHVEIKPTQSAITLVIGGSLPNGTSATDVSRTWKLPKLQQSDLNRLNHSPLKLAHLNDWNTLVEQSDVEDVFTNSLQKLKMILETAEALV